MKEKIFNNIIFILFAILLLLFSLKCFLVSFGIIKEEFLLNMVNEKLNIIYSTFVYQVILALIGFLLLFLVIYLIWLKQKIAQQLAHVKIVNDLGEIKISTSSLEQIILNILSEVEGVKQIKPEIQVQKGENIKTILHLIVNKGCNIPETARYLQQKLKEDLPKLSGIEVKEIKINVDKIDYE